MVEFRTSNKSPFRFFDCTHKNPIQKNMIKQIRFDWERKIKNTNVNWTLLIVYRKDKAFQNSCSLTLVAERMKETRSRWTLVLQPGMLPRKKKLAMENALDSFEEGDQQSRQRFTTRTHERSLLRSSVKLFNAAKECNYHFARYLLSASASVTSLQY